MRLGNLAVLPMDAAAELPPAPASPVGDDGAPAFGTFAGTTGPVDWRRHRGPRRRLAWKRWHYVSVAGPDVVAAVAVVDLGWVANAFGYLFDRRAGRLVADASSMGLPRRAAHVADRAGAGARTTFRARGADVTLARAEGGRWHLWARVGDLVLDAVLEETGADTLCAVAPVPGGVADCTHKTPCLRVAGVASAGDLTVDLGGHWAALDHTSGLLARDTDWRWASATGPDLALNLTEGFTAPAENALWRRGRLERVGPVRFDFDAASPGSPWHIGDESGTVDLEFRPEGVRREDTNLGLARSRYVQPVGVFSGRVGSTEIRDLPGVTEDHAARW
ncbi:MAG TPA: DUF2804 domain-containing protein [Acidimicrobiales bacterium]|nr:DUF2804 domain-containing protein [Acidimicrobiales bacterium]